MYTIEVLIVRNLKFGSLKGILEYYSPGNYTLQIQAQHIVHSSFQGDLGFCSTGQLEPSKSRFKIQGYESLIAKLRLILLSWVSK